MRIATADPPARRTHALRRADPRQRRYARLEFLGLLVVSAVVAHRVLDDVPAAGLDASLTSAATWPRVRSCSRVPPLQPSLAEKLTMFPSAAERRFAAEAIDQYVRDNGPLTHVGALAGVTVQARELRSGAAGDAARSAAARRDGGAAVHAGRHRRGEAVAGGENAAPIRATGVDDARRVSPGVLAGAHRPGGDRHAPVTRCCCRPCNCSPG